MTTLSTIRREIISCQRCPRLRAYCSRVAREKRAAFRDQDYWGKPVPGFGDRRASVLVLGLAPAAHGANRTGRVFTGDRSGDFLVRAMHDVGFANLPTSQGARDGLKLQGAFISAVVRCAPPENKPTPREIANCQPHVEAELAALPNLQVIVALGKIAFDAYWRIGIERDQVPKPRPPFAHGYVFQSNDAPALIASYHPSQQNTNTGKLTPPMLLDIFKKARKLAEKGVEKKGGGRR